MAFCTMASMPVSTYLAQAALSPNLGAPATPLAWQAKQTALYSFSPAGSMAAAWAAGAAGASALAAGAAAGAAGAASALGAGAAAGAAAAGLAASSALPSAAGSLGSSNEAPDLLAM